MADSKWNVVTGATGYTGKYITQRLLNLGEKVKTLTGHPRRHNPFGNQVPVLPFYFDNPEALTENLRGVTTLYNTYWVRFPHGKATFELAIKNTETLINAAKAAGVQRFVHVSIANPNIHSPLPYYRGKAYVEEMILKSGMSHAIIRPTVIFGYEDILINNIAWLLRNFPIFIIPGSGQYRIQPIFIEDLVGIAVRVGQSSGNVVTDAVGPEIFTFRQLIEQIAKKIGSKAFIFHLNPQITLLLSTFIGRIVGDVVLTAEEFGGLAANLLISSDPPKGKTRFSEWLDQNAKNIGKHYANELKRHYNY